MAEKAIRKTTTGKGANYRKTKSGSWNDSKGCKSLQGCKSWK